MKPHEETWTADGLWLKTRGADLAYADQFCSVLTAEQIRLAAQAPAMARLLVLTMDDICDEENEHWQAIRRTLRDAGVIE